MKNELIERVKKGTLTSYLASKYIEISKEQLYQLAIELDYILYKAMAIVDTYTTTRKKELIDELVNNIQEFVNDEN